MTTNYEILDSVRLSGRVINDKLQIVTKRDPDEVVEALGVKADSLPVRIEVHDFTDTEGDTWNFVETGPWRRGNGDYAWAELEKYKDGDAYDAMTVTARSQSQTGATTEEKPVQIYIKIKPVIDGPDRS